MSVRFLSALKVSLSIAIAYCISLSMAWDNPHWAAFLVAFCSLATVGESLLKGMLRTFGTFAAIFVALFLLALFPQDRWTFTLFVSLWVAFCTWKVHANPNCLSDVRRKTARTAWALLAKGERYKATLAI